MERTNTDLGQFIQRRELLGYEQKMARVAYAYGVDLRRSQWLDESTLGEPVLRGVDRRWSRLVQTLEHGVVEGPDHPAPIALMEELVQMTRLLRAPRPALRILRSKLDEPWPVVTPLGTTKSAVQWIVIDALAYRELPEAERRFHLAAAVAHLQCDHGPLFAAHLMARNSAIALAGVRTLFAPWSKVAAFSSDRAGLLAAGTLAPALAALQRESQFPAAARWYPRFSSAAVRERALRDFDRSAIVARMRLLQQPTVDSVERKEGQRDDAESPPSAPAAESAGSSDEASNTADVLRNSWSLARCDERLTRRLGLL